MSVFTGLVHITLAFFMLFTLAVIAGAEETENRIFADPVSGESGSTITIPVCIERNTGFMGFSIEVSYDANVLTPVSASKSNLLPGMFDDSIETAEGNSFKVVYTDSSNRTENGVLFEITFLVSGDATNRTTISLSCIQEDTFNDNWQDVVFHCEQISVSFGGDVIDPVDPEPEPDEKLSTRIKNWAAGLNTPWNRVMSIVVAPVVFILQLFGR